MRVEAEVLKLAASQGLWALLFVALLFYVLRENARREGQYQETIDRLVDSLKTVNDIRDDVCKILKKVEGR